MVLPSRISCTRSGDTSSWSKVPSSRSRAIDRPVTISPISTAITAIRFGTMNHCVSSAGLNQKRGTAESVPFATPLGLAASAAMPATICEM